MIPWLLACAPRVAPPVAVIDPAPADPQPAAAPAELIYFVLVDRYANGDPSNDAASPGPAPDPADIQAWHGGDLRGVLDRLDHIERLGATTVWLSPVFRTRTTPIGPWGAWHGYWQWDPTQVEPRFGTQAELEALARALDQRGMGLMLDLVTNHVGYDAPLLAQHPDWFHDRGTIQDWTDRAELEDGQVHGLPDLDQDHPEVAAWLSGVAAQWQGALELRGYRVDAVRHVPNAFLARLGAEVLARDPQAWWLGEDFTGDVAELAESQRSGGFTHVFDFPLHYAMIDVFCDGAAPARLASVLWQDRQYDRPEGLVTFLDNHDLPRLWTRCHEDPHAVLRALAFLYSTRGVPALTYGTEALLPGGEEPHNRADMDFEGASLAPVLARLMAHRRASAAMRGGRQRVLHLDADAAVLARVQGDEAVVVGINRGQAPRAVALPAALAGGVLVGIVGQAGDAPLHSVTVEAEGTAAEDTAAEDTAAEGTAAEGAAAEGTAAEGTAAEGTAVEDWVLPGQAVRAWRLRGDFGAFQAEGPPRAVEIVATGLPGDAAAVVLTGAGPELGGWSPGAGIALARQGDAWTGTVTVPEGAVLEGKLVVVEPGGPRWAAGENAALLVEGDARWAVRWPEGGG